MKKELVIANLEKELQEVSNKYCKLIDDLNGHKLDELGDVQHDFIEDQLGAMRLYLRTLEMRISDLESDLEEEVAKKKQEEVQKKKEKNKEENKEEKEKNKEEPKKNFDYMNAFCKDTLTYLEDTIKALKKELEN